MLYLWLKALHVIAVIAWMAALLYLPRLFVYHAAEAAASPTAAIFKIMERRLYLAILVPAMIATLVLGLALASLPGYGFWHQPWLHAKLLLVLLMLGFTHFLGKWRREFAQDRNRNSAGFYRAVNEIPTVLMILIVILAVVKPF